MVKILASAATAALAVGSLGYNAYHSMEVRLTAQETALATAQQNLQLIQSAASTVVGDCKVLETYLPTPAETKLQANGGAYVVPQIETPTVTHE